MNDPSVGSGDTVTNPDEPGASDGSCDRTFVFHVQGDALATEVRVAGSFESVPWEGALELRDEDGDGFWQADVSLLPGTYEYRLIVDGTWSPDASNPEFVVNDFGDRNSVFEHVCPFAPVCITDAECGEDAPLCRAYNCVEQEPCYCGEGSLRCPGIVWRPRVWSRHSVRRPFAL